MVESPTSRNSPPSTTAGTPGLTSQAAPRQTSTASPPFKTMTGARLPSRSDTTPQPMRPMVPPSWTSASTKPASTTPRWALSCSVTAV